MGNYFDKLTNYYDIQNKQFYKAHDSDQRLVFAIKNWALELEPEVAYYLSLNAEFKKRICDIIQRVKIRFSDEYIIKKNDGVEPKDIEKEIAGLPEDTSYYEGRKGLYRRMLEGRENREDYNENIPVPAKYYKETESDEERKIIRDILNRSFSYVVTGDYNASKKEITIYLKTICNLKKGDQTLIEMCLTDTLVHNLFLAFYHDYLKRAGVRWKNKIGNQAIVSQSLATYMRVFAWEGVFQEPNYAQMVYRRNVKHGIEVWPAAGVQGIDKQNSNMKDPERFRRITRRSQDCMSEACLAILTEIPYLDYNL